jgi:multisubunit Na+/H+ antiporter MnhB subunit
LTSRAIRKHVVATLLRVRRQRTRWEEDNVAPLNVAALVVVGAIVLGIAGLVLAVALT